MGYCKVIKYGAVLEVYDYENELRINGRRSRKFLSEFEEEFSVPSVDSSEQVSQSKLECEVARRKDNAKRAEMEFRRLVSANLSRVDVPQFITFTYGRPVVEIEVGYRDFKACVQRMRYKIGQAFKYIAIPQWQPLSGRLHLHSLFWGLPTDLFRTERHSRLVAALWGQGFVDVANSDGDLRISTYLSRYMVKSFLDPRLRFHKSYIASRNVLRPVVYSGVPKWFFEQEYKLSTLQLLQKTEYQTKWLGKGRFSKYSLP